MSRHNNVNPAHYKVAGRERQGEALLQGSAKAAYAQQRHEMQRGAIEAQAGLPVWETTPPNLEIPDRPKPRAKKTTRRAKRTAKRMGNLTRKAAPKRKASPAGRTRKAAPTRKAAARRSPRAGRAR